MENTKTLSVADRLEIQDLLARYNFYEDSGQIDAWLGTFTMDGGFIQGTGQSYFGQEQLRAFAVKREQRPDARKTVHWASNLSISWTAEGAEAQYYVMLVDQLPDGGFHIRGMSRKIDDIRQEQGQWKFKCRKSAPLPYPG